MEMVILLLAPLMLSISWSTFAFIDSTVVALVSLLLTSLILPTIFMEYLKLFWPCGLLLILMSTGLIVIFAYIVSLHKKENNSTINATKIFFSFTGLLMMFSLLYNPYPSKLFNSCGEISISLPLSLMLISLLLFLVVMFIRNVYSKGGGFRKKF